MSGANGNGTYGTVDGSTDRRCLLIHSLTHSRHAPRAPFFRFAKDEYVRLALEDDEGDMEEDDVGMGMGS